MEKSYKHLGYFLLLMLPLIFFAFFKSYISKFPDFAIDYDKTIHIHAFFASLWVLMLIVQPFLIINKKMPLHRLVGKASYIVFPLLILSFVPGMIKIIHSGNYRNLFFPLADCIVLVTLYALAMYNKKVAAKHMRFLIASSLTLLGPTIGRIGPVWFGLGDVGTQTVQYIITFAILFGLIAYDKSNKRNFQPYRFATILFAVHAAVFYLLFFNQP